MAGQGLHGNDGRSDLSTDVLNPNRNEITNKDAHTLISMGGKWGVGKKEMCHHSHGVLITITKHGEQKKLVIGHEKDPTTPT